MTNPNDLPNLNIYFAQLSSLLDQGKLIEYYDLGDSRVGIQSIKTTDFEEIALFFKGQSGQEILQDLQAPLIFAKKFIYSVDGQILNSSEKEELVESLPFSVVKALFFKWRELQQKIDNFESNLTDFSKTTESKLKYKLCKFFRTTPDDPRIKNMDRLMQNWFFINILDEEREFNNEILDKIEYSMQFVNPEAVKQVRNRRLMDMGIQIDDPDMYQASDFDQALIEELKEVYPDLDTSQIKTFDDYMRFINEHSNNESFQNSLNSFARYSEEDKNNLLITLEKEKGSPLTESEKEITIYKLENGEPVNLQQIIKEAMDLDAVKLSDASKILQDFNLDD